MLRAPLSRLTPWRRAIERCAALLDTRTRPVLLHGDLHLGNVLDGGPLRGLVAIDSEACTAHEGVEVRCQRVANAIAHLTYDGPESAIDELISLTR
ncbi:phosphotransferase [Amycolatopsis sp. NPDC101161]|uniref:phosphotransferase n=1 Tax=Amycolatopsis sp. NPDC101161 TaxID=3363940 RepID=UPI003830E8C0